MVKYNLPRIDKPTKRPGIEAPPGQSCKQECAWEGEREGYLSVNFDRGSQLSVLVGMFRLDLKPAILLG